MSKVYVVTMSDYFETVICAVFDSPELAAKYVRAFGSGASGELEVEECELNPFADQLQQGFLPFTVLLDLGGKPVEAMPLSPVTREHPEGRALRIFARDEEHALRTAEHKWKKMISGLAGQGGRITVYTNPEMEEQ
jgi:hypothetical protein